MNWQNFATLDVSPLSKGALCSQKRLPDENLPCLWTKTTRCELLGDASGSLERRLPNLPNMLWIWFVEHSANPAPCPEGRTGHLPHLARHWSVQEVFETLPDSCVMLNSKIETQRGVHYSKQVVDTRRCTIKQQDPCALQIWDLPDSLQEGSVFTNLLVELCLDEVRVPKRGAQYSHALPVRGQIVVAPPCVIRFTICEEVFAVGWTIPASVPNLSFPWFTRILACSQSSSSTDSSFSVGRRDS